MPRQKISSFAGTGNSCGATLLGAFTRPLLTHNHALVFLTEIVLRLAYSALPFRLPSEAHSFVLSLPRSHHPRALFEGTLHDYSSSSTVFFIVTPRFLCVKRFFKKVLHIFLSGIREEMRYGRDINESARA